MSDTETPQGILGVEAPGVVLRVAVPSPLRRYFDYLARRNGAPAPGCRVRVPFGRSQRVGLVVEHKTSSHLPLDRLKPVLEVLDEEPICRPDEVELIRWASDYYHHPPGDVVHTALPARLRQGLPVNTPRTIGWRLNESGRDIDPAILRRAPRQQRLMARLTACPSGISALDFQDEPPGWRVVLKNLEAKKWVQRFEVDEAAPSHGSATTPPICNVAQQSAVDAVVAQDGKFQTYLLDGVTGSGKTHVYLSLIEQVSRDGRQVLLLIPEIGLTPQMVARLREGLRASYTVLHSGLSDQERLSAWSMARDGRVSVVIGTRSAVFVPLARPALFIVDEEHDVSYKQQDGFRYSARDLAVYRGRQANAPVVLGSATPCLESLHNVAQGRYRHLRLPERATGREAPRVTLVDLRNQPFDDGLSQPLRDCVDGVLSRGEQALIFVNRRGYAPIWLCHVCGWVADCPRCDSHLVYHRGADRLRCHHCGVELATVKSCPDCSAEEFRALGYGTQRVADAFARHFPGATVARMDRDAMRRKGSLESLLNSVEAGHIDILVGTQMLAKGHHFPNVTLVAILDADGGLFSVDFRAAERMAQLLVQVSGRAGRGDRPGRVLIQTHHPQHPLLQELVTLGYEHFSRAALREREDAELPPMTWHALMRTEAATAQAGDEFLVEAKRAAGQFLAADLSLLGPVPAPMERRAGFYRRHLLVESRTRGALHRLLGPWLACVESLKSGRKVRWSLDVDPQDMI